MNTRRDKTHTIYEVLADGEGDGPAGDGTFVHRFRKQADAQKFAANNTCYGRPATVSSVEASTKLARRWGLA